VGTPLPTRTPLPYAWGTPLPYVQGQAFDSLIEIPSNLRATWGPPSPTRGGPSPTRGDPPPLRGDPLPYVQGSGFPLPHRHVVEFHRHVTPALPTRGGPRPSPMRGGPPPLLKNGVWRGPEKFFVGVDLAQVICTPKTGGTSLFGDFWPVETAPRRKTSQGMTCNGPQCTLGGHPELRVYLVRA